MTSQGGNQGLCNYRFKALERNIVHVTFEN